MRHVCPYCDWPEFTAFRAIEQAERRWFGLRFKRSGKVVVCARCTEQYAIGEQGAYKIAPGKARQDDSPAPPREEERPEPLRLVDEDQASKWR